MNNTLTRSDLIGCDLVAMRLGRPTVRFRYGLLPWAIRRPIALILDNYDVCCPEARAVIGKMLETKCEIYIPENNKLIKPNACFRLFATSNVFSSDDAIGTHREDTTNRDR